VGVYVVLCNSWKKDWLEGWQWYHRPWRSGWSRSIGWVLCAISKQSIEGSSVTHCKLLQPFKMRGLRPEYETVCLSNLVVRPWMRHNSLLYSSQKLRNSRCEWSVVIGDDVVGHSKFIYYNEEEFGGLPCCDLYYRLSMNPLSEFIDCTRWV
jgi:hypothetical protein